jgi:DNA-binding transcriptional ArsR family regulator
VEEIKEPLAMKFAQVFPHLDERQRRIMAAVEARSLGRGGITRVAEATGMSRSTVTAAVKELEAGLVVTDRVRRPGGGAKSITEKYPTLEGALKALVDPETRGDPESALLYTLKSTRQLAAELQAQGYEVSHEMVAQLLRRLRYSLQANAKTREGSSHVDRDAQFRYINDQVAAYSASGDPVISVDAKKKELVGNYKNPGREWQPVGEPEEVSVYDFPGKAVGKAIPYGVYDVGANEGWVSVGSDHDTAAFAVETIRRWYRCVGQPTYPGASHLLICADGGGSNASRSRLWKTELAGLVAETGLEITVCHLPPGTSKWNKIEHRLFSHISMNWRGRPLVSHEVAVELIGATTTRTGLKVRAERDLGLYPTKIKVSDEDLAAVPLHKHAFHGEWNYTIARE